MIKKLVEIETSNEIQIQKEMRQRRTEHPNPLCRYGKFGFSQTDEDGITLEILDRLGIREGSFCEYGVGNGMENNSLILLCKGWHGYWFGGQDLSVDTSLSTRLDFIKTWITRENIFQLYSDYFGSNMNVDVLSLDLDGNDLHLAQELLLKGIQPKLFIVEYNAKFPPTVEFTIEYDAQHTWKGDDYFGASLLSFVKLFEQFGYKLICCNAATGSNAFFIPVEFSDKFSEVPDNIEDIYASPYYFLPKRVGHTTSVKTIELLIK